MSFIQREQWLTQFISQHALIFSIIAVMVVIMYFLLLQFLLERTKSTNFVLWILGHKKGLPQKNENTSQISIRKKSVPEKILQITQYCTTISIVIQLFFSIYLQKQILYWTLLTGVLMILYGILQIRLPRTFPKDADISQNQGSAIPVTSWLFIGAGIILLLLQIPLF